MSEHEYASRDCFCYTLERCDEPRTPQKVPSLVAQTLAVIHNVFGRDYRTVLIKYAGISPSDSLLPRVNYCNGCKVKHWTAFPVCIKIVRPWSSALMKKRN